MPLSLEDAVLSIHIQQRKPAALRLVRWFVFVMAHGDGTTNVYRWLGVFRVGLAKSAR